MTAEDPCVGYDDDGPDDDREDESDDEDDDFYFDDCFDYYGLKGTSSVTGTMDAMFEADYERGGEVEGSV